MKINCSLNPCKNLNCGFGKIPAPKKQDDCKSPLETKTNLGDIPKIAYYIPAFKASNPINLNDLITPGSTVQEMKPAIDLLSFFTSNNDNDYSLDDIRKMILACKSPIDEKYNPDCVEAVKKLAAAKINPDVIKEYVLSASGNESSWFVEPNRKYEHISDNAQDLIDFTRMGIDDSSALALTRYLDLQNISFENKPEVKSFIRKFFNLNIPADRIINIIDSLAVRVPSLDNNSLTYKIDKSAVNALVTIKNSFKATRANELNEQNADNWRDDVIATYEYENSTYYITSSHGIKCDNDSADKESVVSLMAKYDKAISQIEDDLLCSFAKKYKSKDGSINQKYTRTMVILRRNGITYDSLFDCMKHCFNSNGDMSQDSISVISTLKNTGVQSSVIPLVLNEFACDKTTEGNFNPKNINLASSLILSEKKPDDLIHIIQTCKNKNGSVSEPLRDIADYYAFYDTPFICNILNKFISDDGTINETDASCMINEIKRFEDKDNGQVSFVFSSLLDKNYSVPDILLLLNQCRQYDGVVHEGLSDMAVDLALRNFSMDSIYFFIEKCKFQDGEIDDDNVDRFNSILDNNPDISQDELIILLLN